MVAAKMDKSERFDIDRLRELAGAKVFARGEEYYEDDQVELLAVEPKRVIARVAGSEDYRTELRGGGKDIAGSCSCPAYTDWGFCKHMVAVGLAANAAPDAEAADGGALSRIRAHLKTKSVDALADMIVKLAEQDARLFRSLDLAAALSRVDDPKLEARLSKAIDKATGIVGFIDYASAPDWAAAVFEVLDSIEALASGVQAAVGLRLAEQAIERIEASFESIDDSDGHLGGLLQRAQEIHFAAALAARPEPVRLARDLFQRETTSDFDAFLGAGARYAEVLGEEGLAEYRRLAEAAWEQLAPRAGRSRESREQPPYADGRLVRILDYFAERDGDLDARIALRAQNLPSPYRYLELAQFCQAQGRKEEALKYAEDGLWVFEDGRQDERLVLFAADLLQNAGRAQDAEKHLWAAFAKSPSADLYGQLRKIDGEAACRRAVGLLEEQCRQGHGAERSRAAGLLIEILLDEKAFDEAWAAHRKFGASPGVTERLATETEKTHPTAAAEVHQANVEQLVGIGAYAEATKLIARMAKLRDATVQAAYVTALKERHGRKRNLMKLLK
jgi:uncharacterized Zn finger protein